MRRPALIFLLALAACASDRVAGVAHERGFDGGWTSPGGATHLDITGEVATLHFQGRRFVFKPVGSLKGYIGPEGVGLRGDGLDIHVDRETVVVRERGHSVEAPLAKIPPGATASYTRGQLRILGRG